MTPTLDRWLLFSALFLGIAATVTAADALLPQSQRYTAAVRRFADTVMDRGQDHYGPRKTPLFVDGLQVETWEPVRWQKGGRTWVLCNFASQQALMRTLDGLTAYTGEERYRQSAEAAARYALEHLRSTNGLLYWGGHVAWDLQSERPVGQYSDIHEQKNHQPYYALLWRVDAPATRKLLETVWAGHVLDWSLLDYNRHASTEKWVRPKWDAVYKEHVEVPFTSVGNNLSFVNVTPPLLDAGVSLAILDHSTDALTWTRRLIYRWQQGRDPKTGLCGGQLSYRKQDRAQEALGHVHKDINEAKIVASYHRVGRYHNLPLAQMQAAEAMLAAGGPCAEVGHEFIQWASEDLKAYGRNCYDQKAGQFISLLTDGTPIQWQQSKAGYYTTNSFAPAKPDSLVFWGYALAYRLTRDPAHWTMAAEIARRLGLGDPGRVDSSTRRLQLQTKSTDWRAIYALLELARATGEREFLRLACRVADNLLALQEPYGLFPRPERVYARTGDEIPLALLHLAATLDQKDSLVPPAILDHAFFHCEFDGANVPLNPNIADKRTYDSVVFYGN